MKCEICHQAEAVEAITLTVDGKKKELYVCSACAAKAKQHTPQPSAGKRKRPQLTVVGGDGGDLPKPLVEGLVKATIDFMKGVAEVEESEHLTCPACKASWDKIKTSGRIPCPTCWKVFAKKIRTEFLAGEYGPRHVGAAPAVERISDARSARKVLERKLSDAISREDYRLAAKIKQQLDRLSPGTEGAES